MTELTEALKEYPSDWKVHLSRVISVKQGRAYEEVLDSPIVGLAGPPRR